MTRTSTLDPNLGRTLSGSFRIEACLGAGAMGVVYRGVQLSVERPVAIKLMQPLAGTDRAEGEARFRREAAATARLSHPNIVQLIDYGVTEAREQYIIMELLVGRDLGQHLDSVRRLPPPAALKITKQVLQALSEAHAAGVVHRDLKPSNVFLANTRAGETVAKLVDFGIAAMEGASARAKLTRSRHTPGTPAYISPERLKGEVSDGRADLYSAGVMLFEMLTGELPFAADNEASLMLAHLQAAPRTLQDLGMTFAQRDAIQALLDALLAKAPDARPENAGAALEAITDIARTAVNARRRRDTGGAHEKPSEDAPSRPVIKPNVPDDARTPLPPPPDESELGPPDALSDPDIRPGHAKRRLRARSLPITVVLLLSSVLLALFTPNALYESSAALRVEVSNEAMLNDVLRDEAPATTAMQPSALTALQVTNTLRVVLMSDETLRSSIQHVGLGRLFAGRNATATQQSPPIDMAIARLRQQLSVVPDGASGLKLSLLAYDARVAQETLQALINVASDEIHAQLMGDSRIRAVQHKLTKLHAEVATARATRAALEERTRHSEELEAGPADVAANEPRLGELERHLHAAEQSYEAYRARLQAAHMLGAHRELEIVRVRVTQPPSLPKSASPLAMLMHEFWPR